MPRVYSVQPEKSIPATGLNKQKGDVFAQQKYRDSIAFPGRL